MDIEGVFIVGKIEIICAIPASTPFGYGKERQLQRKLVRIYERDMAMLLDNVGLQGTEAARELAGITALGTRIWPGLGGKFSSCLGTAR